MAPFLNPGSRPIKFELYAGKDGAERLESVFATQVEARHRADALVAQGRHPLVRIVASDESGAREIIFEKRRSTETKTRWFGSVSDAPVCDSLDDFFSFESRRVFQRILRPIFDAEKCTPLEALHRPSLLSRISSDGIMRNQLLQKVAQLQAGKLGVTVASRSRFLALMFDEIVELSKSSESLEEFHALHREIGAAALVDRVRQSEEGQANRIYSYVLARALSRPQAWPDKLAALLANIRPDTPSDFIRIVDQAIAEIMDGRPAIQEIIGPCPDLHAALDALLSVHRGDLDARQSGTPALRQLADTLSLMDLPETRRVLVSRFAKAIDAATPLGSDGSDKDSKALTRLIRRLQEPAGLLGGSGMAAAVTRRTQYTFRTSRGDPINLDDAVEQVLACLDAPLARVGYLLDLLAAPLGQTHAAALGERLSEWIEDPSRLGSAGDSKQTLVRPQVVLGRLRAAARAAKLTAPMQDALFERLISRLQGEATAVLETQTLDVPSHLLRATVTKVQTSGPAAEATGPAAAISTPPPSPSPSLSPTPSPSPPQPDGPRLILVYRGRTTVFPLSGAREDVRLGRDPQADIPIKETTVSRRHARITFDAAGGIFLTDASRNGTLLRRNGAPVQRVLHATVPLAGEGMIIPGAVNAEQVDWSERGIRYSVETP